MTLSLYDATIASYLQTLGAVVGFLDKSAKHFEAEGTDLAEIVATRLYPDMAPLQFQIVSVTHHSLGALEGARRGEFAPPSDLGTPDYAALQARVSDALTELEGVSRDEVEALAEREVVFRIGTYELRFTGAGFLLSFSIPNFFFHATTAYDILRMKGAPVGKRDFIGQLRLKS